MQEFFTSLRLVIVSIFVCCVVYTGLLLVFGQLVVPWKADGSLIRNDQGVVIGSVHIAQDFNSPGYFWPRPSAVDYNAAASGGSNLSPKNVKLRKRAKTIIQRLDPAPGQLVPADLVTASGSGLDPDITLDAAMFQVPRVAAARHISVSKLRGLVRAHTDSPTINFFGGEPLVNVLLLNIALDRITTDTAAEK